MTTAAENDLLTRVGRGTPMGELMREFWIPACASSELAPDGDPMRLMLLGEKLIAFRDSAGRPAIFDHRCPHRGASLFFGRNEAGGIRCLYHGWKYDVTGACLDQPNLPEARRHPDKVRAMAYRTAERGGIVYVYMGRRATPPALPDIEATMDPHPDARNMAMFQRDCNWLQALEGDIDTSHLGFLHAGAVDPARMDPDDPHTYNVLNKAPEVYASEMPWGTMYSASRPSKPGHDQHRYASFIFPFWVVYPADRIERNRTANAWVPIDDHHTMVFNIDLARASGRFKTMSYADGKPVPGVLRPMKYLPTTTDWMGRWRPQANASNDYEIDRAWQRSGESFSGIVGIPLQDQAIQESMGEVVDRTMENLASSDLMVVYTRRALLKAVREHAANGRTPRVLDEPSLCRTIRGGDVIVPQGTPWMQAYDAAIATLFATRE
jgi:phenylpropionate dioxygenase-like ring-hydroxylating dioxygenase large terminal subunit